MPIRPEYRHLYDGPMWRMVSRYVRFDRARGLCEHCGRPHGLRLHFHADGRTFERADWRYPDGAPAPYPNLLEWGAVSTRRVWLATAHLNHNPLQTHDRNLAALCQRCHLAHDRDHHVVNARSTRRRRREEERAHYAVADLFPPEPTPLLMAAE